MFAFLYVNANSKEICEEISFSSFFRKMLMSAFLLIFKANYVGKNAWLPPFFIADSNSPCEDLLFPRGPTLAQEPSYLVGTVLNTGLSRILHVFQIKKREVLGTNLAMCITCLVTQKLLLNRHPTDIALIYTSNVKC